MHELPEQFDDRSGFLSKEQYDDLVSQLEQELAKENVTIHMENGSRIVMVGHSENVIRGRSIALGLGFHAWDTEAFTPAHALAYQSLPTKKFMEALTNELYAPKPKSPKQTKDDLRSFLARKDGRQKGRRW